MTSEQAFNAPHQLQFKTKHCIIHSVTDPYSQTPYSRREPGEKKKVPFICPVFFILQGTFFSLNSEERLAHMKLCCANWVATGIRTRVTEAGGECVFVHSCSLMSAYHSCSLFTTYTLSNNRTDKRTLLICSFPVLKADKGVVILQVKD